jgi:UDP-N-acetylmuramate--alanine ligase
MPSTSNDTLWSTADAALSTPRPTARHAHLVGIGGAGMRSLAEVLAGQGWSISGSDTCPCAVRELVRVGVQVRQSHRPEHIPRDTDLLIYSAAIDDDNPERRFAASRGMPVRSYAEMLGRLSAGKCSLAVAGTHGKSTTTAMAAEILTKDGADPTVVCGAIPSGATSGGRAGRGDIVLVEACEYRQNFLHLRPEIAVVTSIEPDHFDCYDTFGDLTDAFRRFIENIAIHGIALIWDGCPLASRLAIDAGRRYATYGFEAASDWRAERLVGELGCYRFQILRGAESLGEVTLQAPGRHNVLNALAAAAMAYEAGASAEAICDGLSSFGGLHRRLEVTQILGGPTLLDDYAHHPSEIHEALATASQMFPGRKIWCVFQPHQQSRTAHLLDEFADSLQNAHAVAVADVFRARENSPKVGDVTAGDLARAVEARGTETLRGHQFDLLTEELSDHVDSDDVIVVLGAGDIWKLRNELFDRLRVIHAGG